MSEEDLEKPLEIPKVTPPAPDHIATKIKTVLISQLQPFPNHPFDVPDKDNPEMQDLMQDIEEHKLIELPIVRKLNENEYQILSGHRRVQACEYLNHTEIRVKIISCKDDDEALNIVLHANNHRKNIKLSEQIKSCRLLYKSKSHQGKKQEDSEAKTTRQEISTLFHVSEGTIQGYMELSKLSDVLLAMLDTKRFTKGTGKIISKLKPENQKLVEDILTTDNNIKIKNAQAKKILKAEKGTENLTTDAIKNILAESEQPTEQIRERGIKFSSDEIKNYFPDGTTDEAIKTKLLELLTVWKSQENNN